MLPQARRQEVTENNAIVKRGFVHKLHQIRRIIHRHFSINSPSEKLAIHRRIDFLQFNLFLNEIESTVLVHARTQRTSHPKSRAHCFVGSGTLFFIEITVVLPYIYNLDLVFCIERLLTHNTRYIGLTKYMKYSRFCTKSLKHVLRKGNGCYWIFKNWSRIFLYQNHSRF